MLKQLINFWLHFRQNGFDQKFMTPERLPCYSFS